MSTTPFTPGSYPVGPRSSDFPSGNDPDGEVAADTLLDAGPAPTPPPGRPSAASSAWSAVGGGLAAAGRSLARTPLAWTQVVGGLLAALGTLLPWITYTGGDESVSRNGFDYGGDGVVILAFGLALAGLGLTSALGVRLPGVPGITSLVLAAAATLVGALAWIEVLASGPREVDAVIRFAGGLHVGSGVGIWFVLVGAVASLVAAAVPAVLASRTRS